jgi:hypothetical protein
MVWKIVLIIQDYLQTTLGQVAILIIHVFDDLKYTIARGGFASDTSSCFQPSFCSGIACVRTIPYYTSRRISTCRA